MSDEPAIVFDHVSKMYHKRAGMGTLFSMIPGIRRRHADEFWALKDVSFEVKKGECLGIIGPNGAGKSTILKILSRITSPTSGSFQVNGRLSSLIEVGAGFHPELTGRENVYLNAAILGMSKKETDARFKDIVDFAELWDFIDVPVKRYSSGMYVRLGFAVAAHVEPEVLLIDEVLAVGDILFRQKCFQHMRALRGAAAKIFISHDMDIVSRICDRVIVLYGGQVRLAGGPSEGVAYVTRQAHLDASSQHMSAEADEIGQRTGPPAEGWIAVPHERRGGGGSFGIERALVAIKGSPGTMAIVPDDEMLVRMRILAERASERVIIGYFFRDKNGSIVFGDNTLASGVGHVIIAHAGMWEVEFSIRWPRVASGEYTLTLGVGEGETQEFQFVQDWAHNILVIQCVNAKSAGAALNNPFVSFRVWDEDNRKEALYCAG